MRCVLATITWRFLRYYDLLFEEIYSNKQQMFSSMNMRKHEKETLCWRNCLGRRGGGGFRRVLVQLFLQRISTGPGQLFKHPHANTRAAVRRGCLCENLKTKIFNNWETCRKKRQHKIFFSPKLFIFRCRHNTFAIAWYSHLLKEMEALKNILPVF